MTVKSKKEEIKELLERLNRGDMEESVKEEARELIKSIDARELSEAEQALIDEGLPETELRHLCAAHIETMAPELEKLKAEVQAGHPLKTLISEHDEILKILDRLERVNQAVQELEEYDAENPVFKELKEVGASLLDTEKHHQREEEALFPEVDKAGVTGPTRIMRMEHEDLWPRKIEVDKLARGAREVKFKEFKDRLRENTGYIAVILRDHIYKENHILYPTALQVIPADKWEEIQRLCAQIGYCSFTPLLKK